MEHQKKSRSRSLPTSKRRKVTNACDNCKKRKYKCTGQQPCYLCQKRGNECNYLILDKRSLKGERLAKQRQLALDQAKKDELASSGSTLLNHHKNSISEPTISNLINPVNTNKIPSLASVLPTIKFQQPSHLHQPFLNLQQQQPIQTTQPLPPPPSQTPSSHISVPYFQQNNYFNHPYHHSFPSGSPTSSISTPSSSSGSSQSSLSLGAGPNANTNYYPYYPVVNPVTYPSGLPVGYNSTPSFNVNIAPPPTSIRSYSTSYPVSNVPINPSSIWAGGYSIPIIKSKSQESTNSQENETKVKPEEPGVLYNSSTFDHSNPNNYKLKPEKPTLPVKAENETTSH